MEMSLSLLSSPPCLKEARTLVLSCHTQHNFFIDYDIKIMASVTVTMTAKTILVQSKSSFCLILIKVCSSSFSYVQYIIHLFWHNKTLLRSVLTAVRPRKIDSQVYHNSFLKDYNNAVSEILNPILVVGCLQPNQLECET